jgi:hypothetical protein
MNTSRIITVLLLTVLSGIFLDRVRAEEIWLVDNTRIYGLVTGARENAFEITLPSSEVKVVALDDVIAIGFRGRTPRFTQIGTQEIVFQRGGVLRGEIIEQTGENISVMSSASGPVAVDTRKLTGLIGLPVEGIVGRRALDLLALKSGPNGPQLDQLIDRRGSRYPGVVQRVDRANIYLDHEDVLRPVPFSWGDLAGVRLADADKTPTPPLPTGPYLRIRLRDGSRFDGVLQSIRIGVWHLRPLWEEKATIPVDVDEVVSVQVMSGKVQYLSHLPVATSKEVTIIAPPHPYRLDRNCEGGGLSIGGLSFPWGVGVHANSALVFELDGRFSQFCATIGLDTSAGREGSITFRVLGDGKEIYRSPVLKGGDAPVEIAVPILGMKQLILCVNDVGGNDLGDAADWGAARVVR